MTNNRKSVVFKKTDEMGVLVRDLVIQFYEEQDLHLNRKIIRKRKKELFLAIEAGIKEIDVNTVKAHK